MALPHHGHYHKAAKLRTREQRAEGPQLLFRGQHAGRPTLSQPWAAAPTHTPRPELLQGHGATRTSPAHRSGEANPQRPPVSSSSASTLR